MKFRKIATSIWSDGTFIGLSQDAKFTWLFILTHPALTSFGALALPLECLASQLAFGKARAAKALGELAPMLAGNPEAPGLAQVYYCKNFLKHNAPENPNVIKSWAGGFETLPEGSIRDQILADLAECARQKGAAFIAAFHEAFSPWLGKRGTLPETISETLPEDVMDTVHDTVSDTISDTLSETVSGTVSDTLPETVSDTIPETLSETVMDTLPETVAGTVSGTVAETMNRNRNRNRILKTEEDKGRTEIEEGSQSEEAASSSDQTPAASDPAPSSRDQAPAGMDQAGSVNQGDTDQGRALLFQKDEYGASIDPGGYARPLRAEDFEDAPCEEDDAPEDDRGDRPFHVLPAADGAHIVTERDIAAFSVCYPEIVDWRGICRDMQAKLQSMGRKRPIRDKMPVWVNYFIRNVRDDMVKGRPAQGSEYQARSQLALDVLGRMAREAV